MIKKNDENTFKRLLRFIKYNKLFTLVASVVLIMILFILFSDNGFLKRVKFQKEKERIENQVIIEKKTQDSLRKIIDSLSNSNIMIEKVAREKYYMSKEGEKIYKIEYDSNGTE